MWCEIFTEISLFFFPNIAKDLKHSLPAGLGLSETQITSHGFDSTKEGVTEVGAYQGKRPCIFKRWLGWRVGGHQMLPLLKRVRIEPFNSMIKHQL